MSKQYEVLGLNEVINLEEDNQLLLEHSTFKVLELLQQMEEELGGYQTDAKELWFGQGAECEVLSPNRNWRKGKVRICLAFLDDEPETLESPLDSIRETSVD